MQRDRLKFPTMQCSHPQKPSISSALWRDVPAHEQNRGREKWRKVGEAQQSPQECCWVLNKWKTPFGIQTNQSLSYRTSFSHSASVEKTAANQARDCGIGMQQRAAMRFVGGSLAPLSQQSAVSRLRLGRSGPSPQCECAIHPGTGNPCARLPGYQPGQAPRGIQMGQRAC